MCGGWGVIMGRVKHTFHAAKNKDESGEDSSGVIFAQEYESRERAQTSFGAPSDPQISDLPSQNELEFPQINGVFMLHRALAAAHSRAGRTPAWPQTPR